MKAEPDGETDPSSRSKTLALESQMEKQGPSEYFKALKPETDGEEDPVLT